MSDLTCQHCGHTFEPIPSVREFRDGSLHYQVNCPGCNQFCKWLSQGGPPKLYYGKHKGRAIKDVLKEDRRYIEWLSRQSWVDAKLRALLVSALQESDG